MAKLSFPVGTTSQTINIWVQNSTVTTGAGLAGLTSATSNLIAYYALPRQAPVAITLTTQTITASYVSGGFVELDATHTPGLYRFDPPNAAFTTGTYVDLFLSGAASMAQTVMEIELTAVNNQDAVAFGLSRLDAAVTTRLAPTVAARTLDVSATGGAGIDWGNVENPTTVLDLSSTTISTSQQVNTTKFGGTTVTGRDIGASVLLSSGTGTGQIKIASGYISPNWADVGTPTATVSLTNTTIAAVTTASTVTTLTAAANEAIADAWTARNIAGGSNTGRTNGQAMAFLRNKWTLALGTLTVFSTDDSTTLWTAAVSTDAAALPIIGNDPA